MTVSSQKVAHSYFPGAAMLAESLAGLQAMQTGDFVVTDAAGVLQAPGTDYQISGDVRSGNGSIRALRAYAVGVELTVTRRTARVQEAQITVHEPLPAVAIERELDRRAMIEDELAEATAGLAARALLVRTGDPVPPVLHLADFAGKFWAGDAAGNPVPASAPVAGSDAALRADLALPSGAGLIGIGAGLTLADIVEIRSSTFASLNAAVQAWAAAGGRLIINLDYDITTPIFASLTSANGYQLDCDGPRKIRFIGAHAGYAIRLFNPGTIASPLVISPLLTIDGLQNVNICLWVDFNLLLDPALYQPCQIGGTYLNTRSTIAVNFPDSCPLAVSGGFSALTLRDVTAKNATREAGAGIPGTRGSGGIIISAWPKTMVISDFNIENITTEDAFGTVGCGDMDGLLVFNHAVDFGTPNPAGMLIERGRITDARGRGIKRFSKHGGGATRDITIVRSGVPSTVGCEDISHQDSGGNIENVKIDLSGSANLGSTGTVPIMFNTNYTRAAGFEHEPNTIRDIAIHDTTGVAKRAVINVSHNAAGAEVRLIEIANVRDTGTAEVFSASFGLGAAARATVLLNNIDVSLVHGFFKTEEVLSNLRVTASGLRNRGATVAVVVTNAFGPKNIGFGNWKGDASVLGFFRFTGAWVGAPGFRAGFYGPGGGCESDVAVGSPYLLFTGPVRLSGITVGAGVTWSAPPCGTYQDKGGNYAFRIERHDVSDYAHFVTGHNVVSMSAIRAAPPGITVQNGGASLATADLEVWKDLATQELRVRNGTGGAITFTLTLNP